MSKTIECAARIYKVWNTRGAGVSCIAFAVKGRHLVAHVPASRAIEAHVGQEVTLTLEVSRTGGMPSHLIVVDMVELAKATEASAQAASAEHEQFCNRRMRELGVMRPF